MKFKKKDPSLLLQPYVKNFWLVEILAEDLPFSQLYFPYGSFELIHYLEERGRMQYIGNENAFLQPTLFYSGQFTKPFTLSFDKPCKILGVSLHPWVGNIVYKIPSNYFTDQMIELTDLDNNSFFQITDFSTEDDDGIFSSLEAYILERVITNTPDEVSAFIAQSVIKSPNRNDVNRAISKIGLSKRRIEQRFLNSTGLTIGAFTRKIRFQKAVSLLNNPNHFDNLTHIGYEAGYFDQSHFINEFKEFSALSPMTFLKQNSELKDFISSQVKQ